MRARAVREPLKALAILEALAARTVSLIAHFSPLFRPILTHWVGNKPQRARTKAGKLKWSRWMRTEQGLEGIVAKRLNSAYEPGERYGEHEKRAWQHDQNIPMLRCTFRYMKCIAHT